MSKAEKLIKEYENKIELIDTQLKAVGQCILKARHENQNYLELLKDRTVLNDQRQIYYQFIKDLEDLL